MEDVKILNYFSATEMGRGEYAEAAAESGENVGKEKEHVEGDAESTQRGHIPDSPKPGTAPSSESCLLTSTLIFQVSTQVSLSPRSLL